ncbi:hypothetical protein C8R44DRAFT_748674 [Mycena epipterygia]|nr:hypothetical protein C8R44DRAFT_748674 [Mycena epipterygia]
MQTNLGAKALDTAAGNGALPGTRPSVSLHRSCSTSAGAVSRVRSAGREYASHAARTAVRIPFARRVQEDWETLVATVWTSHPLHWQSEIHTTDQLLSLSALHFIWERAQFSNTVLVKPETPLSTDPAGVVYYRRPFRSTLWRRALPEYEFFPRDMWRIRLYLMFPHTKSPPLPPLDLINCTSEQSTPSASNPSLRDVGSVAARLQSETDEPGVVTPVDVLVPFQMVYEDGV